MTSSKMSRVELVDEELYKENVLDHNKNPRNKRIIPSCTCQHTENNPLCGDKITIYLKIKKNKLEDISFMGDGCAISQASASLLTEHVQHFTVKQLKDLSSDDILTLLGIPISHTRMKCAQLCLKTLQKALED